MNNERRDEILQAAHATGYDLTGDQLERWHRAGLIPRPHQIGLGRGAGSVSVYPSGTTRQVLAALALRPGRRALPIERAGVALPPENPSPNLLLAPRQEAAAAPPVVVAPILPP